MRPHGHYDVSQTNPMALGVCDLCGKITNRNRLQWQFDWRGARLQNLRVLRCERCIDEPQQQLRTVILPQDPVPIQNPRTENYVSDDNPLSPLNFDPNNLFVPISQRGGAIGNMTLGGGTDAAFNGVTNKPFAFCAQLSISNSSFQNTVGVNWGADPTGVTTTLPSTVPAQTHVVASFTAYAPNDKPFLNSGATGWHLDGSSNNAAWTTLGSGTTAGTKGEKLTATSTATGTFQYHRFALQGDGLNSIAIAQLQLNVADGYSEP